MELKNTVNTELYQGDIKRADAIMRRLLDDSIIDKGFDYESIEDKRTIAVLVENGYLFDAVTLLQQTDRSALYFNNGGATAIYTAQQRAKKMADMEYSNIRWTNIRSWIAIGLSAIALLIEVVSFFR